MKNVKGFTLIEMMIVVAIIGIIAAFATTSYQKSVIKSKRADAKTTLLDIATQFERCFSANGQYTTTAGPPPKDCPVVSDAGVLNLSADSLKGYYNITLDAVDAVSFTISAAPKADWADADCTSFTLNNIGQQIATGNIGTGVPGNSCW